MKNLDFLSLFLTSWIVALYTLTIFSIMLMIKKPRVHALLNQSTHFLYHGVLNLVRFILSSNTQLSNNPEKKSTNCLTHSIGHCYFMVVFPVRRSLILLTKNFRLSKKSPSLLIILAVLIADPSFFHRSFISAAYSVERLYPPTRPFRICGTPQSLRWWFDRLYSEVRTLKYYMNFRILLKSAISPFKSSLVFFKKWDLSSTFFSSWTLTISVGS